MIERPKRFLPVEEHLPLLAGGGWRAVGRSLLERVMGLPEIRRQAGRMEEAVARGQDSFTALFELMQFELDARGVVEAIPATGPVVAIANHPFGGAEALALASLCLQARPDVKVLGNAEVLPLPGMDKWVLPLEILGSAGAARKNAALLKLALAHLRNGGLLVVFPAGAVAHWRWESARVEDPPWPLHTARLVNKSGAAVLPVRFFGHNGPLFQILGTIHPLLRSALLTRAFLAMRGRPVRGRAGRLLMAHELPREPGAMTGTLRAAVDGVLPGDGN